MESIYTLIYPSTLTHLFMHPCIHASIHPSTVCLYTHYLCIQLTAGLLFVSLGKVIDQTWPLCLRSLQSGSSLFSGIPLAFTPSCLWTWCLFYPKLLPSAWSLCSLQLFFKAHFSCHLLPEVLLALSLSKTISPLLELFEAFSQRWTLRKSR